MKTGRIIISVIIGIVLAFVIREVLYSLLVVDDCAYHNGKEPGFIIANFYGMPSWNGFHPAPNLLNNIVTPIIGGLIGFLVYYFVVRIVRRKNALQQKI